MKEYLTGTSGRLLQILLGVLGLIFAFSGIVSFGTSQTVNGSVYSVLSVLCWGTIGGIRYWLRRTVRNR